MRFPGKPGWAALVREVGSALSCGQLWKDDRERVIGAPLGWCLVERHGDPPEVVPTDDTCGWTGRAISGHTPMLPDGRVDGTPWGVRCARCGVAIHHSGAGMAHTMDVPSCPPCRGAVRRAAAG
mgnify:CR=1 FL=1